MRDSITSLRPAPATTALLASVLGCAFLPGVARADDLIVADGPQIVVNGFGTRSYKLPAGHLLLYPSTSLHRVTPVTRGERVGCFFWLQSLVADHAAREMLYDLDQSVQALTAERGKADAQVPRLTALYHNLVRRWAEA
ncbi:MAG TPA: hypothetical protein VLM18_08670 [Croceibacterium sp.]|nr:hypothetical protein [Croceibacterium sp.]